MAFGDVPDKDASVLARSGERGSARVDCHSQYAATMRPMLRPGTSAGFAVERVDATGRIGYDQDFAAAGPAPGDGVVVDRRRPAAAKNAPWAVDIQTLHASNPCRMLSSWRLRPMKTS